MLGGIEVPAFVDEFGCVLSGHGKPFRASNVGVCGLLCEFDAQLIYSIGVGCYESSCRALAVAELDSFEFG